jgi:segregation and condensation protein B
MAEPTEDAPELVSEEPLAGEAEEEPAAEPGDPGSAANRGSEPSGAETAPEAAAEPVEKDEKQLAREEKERTRRLREYFREILDQLIADYAKSERGLEIREVASGFRLATKPEYHDAVRGFVKSLKPPLKLTLQALETLAVVAYKQPVTAPEISEIRGVDSSGVLGSLISRKLIATAGRKQVIGRPILYKTTRDFLLRFGLKDVSELPSIEEFEKLAGELADSEAVQEEIPMPEPPTSELVEDLEPSKGEVEPQADGDSTPLGQPIGTPEGDNEARPDAPLEPAGEDLQVQPAIDTDKL